MSVHWKSVKERVPRIDDRFIVKKSEKRPVFLPPACLPEECGCDVCHNEEPLQEFSTVESVKMVYDDQGWGEMTPIYSKILFLCFTCFNNAVREYVNRKDALSYETIAFRS